MRSPRPRRLRNLSLNSLAPNILTVLALCAGLTAIRLALEGRFGAAVAAIIVAGALDGLDGRLARLLKGASKFGAELDSLSDVVSFGVAPGLVLYIWTLQDLGRGGWIVVLALAVSCALRLARFNIQVTDPNRPAWAADFFTGISAPVGAGLAMLPMTFTFLTDLSVFRSPPLVAAWTVTLALLMVSRVPTFSFKRARVRRDRILPTLLLVGLMAALLATYPWVVLSAIGLAYVVTIPFSMLRHRRLAKTITGAAPEIDVPDEHEPEGDGDPDADDVEAEEDEMDDTNPGPAGNVTRLSRVKPPVES